MAAGRRLRILRAGGTLGSVVAAVALFVAQQEVTGTAVLWMGEAGSCTRGTAAEYDPATSCPSLQAAYTAAQDGDTVRIAPGTYANQAIARATGKAVTFEGAGAYPRLGATVVDADDITLRHVRIENRQATNPFFASLQIHSNPAQDAPERQTYDDVIVDGLENAGGSRIGISGDGTDITFQHGSVGNIRNEKGLQISGTRITVDDWFFHDVIVTDPLVHNECIYAIDVPFFTIRNSRFWNCPTMDLFFTFGSWWEVPGPPSTDVTVENNVFSHSRNLNGGGWHVYSMFVGATDFSPDPEQPTQFPDLYRWTVRNNTFEITPYIGPGNFGDRQAHDSVWANNIGAWACMPGMVFRNNVGQVCDPSDTESLPASSSATETAAVGWRDPARNDFRLTAGSPAIAAGDAAEAPETDIRGTPRADPPSAGAYEYP